MKKLGLIVILLLSLLSRAQQNQVNNNIVSVAGRATVQREITMYRGKISLNMEQLYYTDRSCKTLEEFKEKYFKELKANGIDPKELKENKLEFLTYGYQTEGTVFNLETNSQQKIEDLAKIKMTGVTVQFHYKSEIKPGQRAKILGQALEDAKQNAERVCTVAGKTLGNIISITDNSLQDYVWNSYSLGNEEYLTIHVNYEMK